MLIGLALLQSCATPATARIASASPWSGFIAEAATRFDVPAAWIERVMAAESAGQTVLRGRPIRSPAGAMGLMQIMPATWIEMRARLGLGINPDDPHDNIMAGTFYLRLMYERFGFPGLFGAYNAGPRRYGAHLAGGARLPLETVAYLAELSGAGLGSSAVAGIVPVRTAPSPLFMLRHDGAAPTAPQGQSLLFALRSDAR